MKNVKTDHSFGRFSSGANDASSASSRSLQKRLSSSSRLTSTPPSRSSSSPKIWSKSSSVSDVEK